MGDVVKIEELVSDGGEPYGYYAMGRQDPKEFVQAVCDWVELPMDELCVNPEDVVHGWFKLVPIEGHDYDKVWQEADANEPGAFEATFGPVDY